MDRKRVNGPEASVAPIFKKTEDTLPILNTQRKRLDQRGAEDIRAICEYPRFSSTSTFDSFSIISYKNWTRNTSERISLY